MSNGTIGKSLFLIDCTAVFAGVFLGALTLLPKDDLFFEYSNLENRQQFNYLLLSSIIFLAWVSLLGLFGSRKIEILGTGADEYQRVSVATLFMSLCFITLFFISNAAVSRMYFVLTVVVGSFFLLLFRNLYRRWVIIQRRKGRFLKQTLILGSSGSVSALLSDFSSLSEAGLWPKVAATTDAVIKIEDSIKLFSIRNFNDITQILKIIDEFKISAIVICNTDLAEAINLKKLSWALEALNIEMFILPGIADVVSPRMKIRNISGINLIRLAAPEFSGSNRLIKRAVDMVFSGILIFLLSPLFFLLWLIIYFDKIGSPIFRQKRVGINGEIFTLLKFRSMKNGPTNDEFTSLGLNDAAGPLFKLKEDPRVTNFGRFIRKWSLDELPQLINVFRGEMSLVGPRPPLQSEVELYDFPTKRRLLVKPGITGLWQVSGRSNLSWEQSVKLDLFYVENWSLSLDFLILAKTFKVVFTREGAY